MSTREKRFCTGKIEAREITAEQKAAGYIGAIDGFIPYESESRELRDSNGRAFVERLSKGVFSRSLAEDPVTVFADVGHDDAATFARRGVNLEITETDAGVKWSALIPDTSVGRDLRTNVSLGIIDGTSFEFELSGEGADAWEKRGTGNLRTIRQAILHRVNPVTVPAYPESTLSTRSYKGLDEIETPATPAPDAIPPFTLTGARAARFGLPKTSPVSP